MKYGVDVIVTNTKIVSTFVDASNEEEAKQLARKRVFEQEQRTAGGRIDGIKRVTKMEHMTS